MTLAAPVETARSIPPGPRVCLDCGAVLAGKYCSACGQKDEPLKRSLKDLALEFFQHPLIDTKLWKSLLPLLLRPGALTLEYLAGRRTRYVRPLKLYLTVSVLFFALLALKAPATETFKVQVDPSDAAPAAEGLQAKKLHLPIHWLDERFQRNSKALSGPEGTAARQALSQRIASLIPKAVFVLLPLSAVLFKLFWRKRYFVEHLVFTLHLHAYAFAAMLPTLLPWAPLTGVYLVWSSVYSTLAFKRVYQDSWGVALAKLFGVSLVYSLLLAAALLGVTFSALLVA